MLYVHATIITVNSARDIILSGAILVKDNLIADIAKTETLLANYAAEMIVDLTGRIIIPGLISTQTLLRDEFCSVREFSKHFSRVLFSANGLNVIAIVDYSFLLFDMLC